MTRLPPVPRWSPSTDREVRAATGDRVRLLTDADTAALAALSARAPVSNVFVDSLLEAGRLAGPRGGAAGTLFLGIDDDARPQDGLPVNRRVFNRRCRLIGHLGKGAGEHRQGQ